MNELSKTTKSHSLVTRALTADEALHALGLIDLCASHDLHDLRTDGAHSSRMTAVRFVATVFQFVVIRSHIFDDNFTRLPTRTVLSRLVILSHNWPHLSISGQSSSRFGGREPVGGG